MWSVQNNQTSTTKKITVNFSIDKHLYEQFKSFDCNVDIYDPWIDKDHAYKEYNIKLIDKPKTHYYDAIVLAVSHDKFKALSEKQIRAYGKDKHILYDIKYLLKSSESDGRL